MKKLLALLIALTAALAATPALAAGPYDNHLYRLIGLPFEAVGGIGIGLLHGLVTTLALAALGILVVVFLPNQTRQVSETAQKAAAPSLGVGCLTSLVVLPLLVLLVALIVTIPLAMVLPIVLAAAWALGWIALGWMVGDQLLAAFNARADMRTPVLAVVAGVIALAIVSAVPVVGWLVSLAAGLIGLGAVVLSRFGTRAYPPTAGAILTVPPQNVG